MTQPAKVQEPSMEEILASIRRIIADDEAKPPAGEKPAAPPVAPVAAKPEKPAAAAPGATRPAAPKPVADVSAQKPAAAAAKPAQPAAPPPAPPPPPAPAPAPAASNGQDDIDALLAGLDETNTDEEVSLPDADGDVFELTDEMAVPARPAAASLPPRAAQPAFPKAGPDDDHEFSESAASRSTRRPAALEPPAAPSQAILSHSTVATVQSAFNALANTVLSNNARTLEDLVKEMLRPMLKSWLDDNLPGLVERIVKAEIERVSRGR
jgi:uncharacterized protein